MAPKSAKKEAAPAAEAPAAEVAAPAAAAPVSDRVSAGVNGSNRHSQLVNFYKYPCSIRTN